MKQILLLFFLGLNVFAQNTYVQSTVKRNNSQLTTHKVSSSTLRNNSLTRSSHVSHTICPSTMYTKYKILKGNIVKTMAVNKSYLRVSTNKKFCYYETKKYFDSLKFCPKEHVVLTGTNVTNQIHYGQFPRGKAPMKIVRTYFPSNFNKNSGLFISKTEIVGGYYNNRCNLIFKTTLGKK